jgi:hypothetical protein
MEHFLNFLYYELIFMIIALLAWYGLSVMFDTGLTEQLQGVVENPAGVEKLITLAISYVIFLMLFGYQHWLNKYQLGGLKVFYIKEIVYSVAFIVVIASWHAIWDGYDLLVLKTEHEKAILWATHFGTYLLAFVGQIGTSLYGPRGFYVDFEEGNRYNANQSVKAYIVQYSHISLFDVTYFSKKLKDLTRSQSRKNIMNSTDEVNRF